MTGPTTSVENDFKPVSKQKDSIKHFQQLL